MHALDLTWRYQNKLLSLLDEADFLRLASLLVPCEVEHKQVLVERGAHIRHIDFPCSCVYSVVIDMADGNTVEVGTIGNEGVTSLNALFDGNVASASTVCQIPGVSLRLPIDEFQWEAEANLHFRTVLNLYGQAYLALLEQSAACNKLHSLEQRAARWLLMTHDRVQRDEFNLTQEFLAVMLGAQRPTVSLLARKFEQAGALTYTRGTMRILNRDILTSHSCECYSISRQCFERLLGMRVG